jgi:hypothetical protein
MNLLKLAADCVDDNAVVDCCSGAPGTLLVGSAILGRKVHLGPSFVAMYSAMCMCVIAVCVSDGKLFY